VIKQGVALLVLIKVISLISMTMMKRDKQNSATLLKLRAVAVLEKLI
jgi:hypothetical protein